jgi:hypothetical protein
VDYSRAIFKPPLMGPEDGADGRTPVIFDILGPDRETSILPLDYRLVLWANPSEMSFSYSRKVERIQTRGGFVEQHWGDDTQTISLTAVTGGFMRLYSGMSNVTNPALGGTRRDTLAYDRYLDFLSLFHNNGSVYDVNGQVGLQGIIKVTFDGGVYLGWFNSFSVSEAAAKPFMFDLTADFDIAEEIQVWRTQAGARSAASENDSYAGATSAADLATPPLAPAPDPQDLYAGMVNAGMMTFPTEDILSSTQQAGIDALTGAGGLSPNPDGTPSGGY